MVDIVVDRVVSDIAGRPRQLISATHAGFTIITEITWVREGFCSSLLFSMFFELDL